MHEAIDKVQSVFNPTPFPPIEILNFGLYFVSDMKKIR